MKRLIVAMALLCSCMAHADFTLNCEGSHLTVAVAVNNHHTFRGMIYDGVVFSVDPGVEDVLLAGGETVRVLHASNLSGYETDLVFSKKHGTFTLNGRRVRAHDNLFVKTCRK